MAGITQLSEHVIPGRTGIVRTVGKAASNDYLVTVPLFAPEPDISWLIEQFARTTPPASACGGDRNVQQRLLAIAIDGLYVTGASPLPGHPPTTQHYEQRWQFPPAPE